MSNRKNSYEKKYYRSKKKKNKPNEDVKDVKNELIEKNIVFNNKEELDENILSNEISFNMKNSNEDVITIDKTNENVSADNINSNLEKEESNEKIDIDNINEDESILSNTISFNMENLNDDTVVFDKINVNESTTNINSNLKQEDNILDDKKSKYISYKDRVLKFILLSFIPFIIGIILLVFSISINSKSEILYNQSSDVDYKVYLKENDYYNTPYLEKNMQYIASLIDKIDIKFNYNFMMNNNINYKYTYYIESKLLVTDSSDKTKVIYSKNENLISPTTLTKNSSSGFNINENLNIDYQKYNELIKNLKSSYAISAKSFLQLNLYVNVVDEKGNVIKNTFNALGVNIPLTEQMIDISIDYNKLNDNSNNKAKVYTNFNISNKYLFVLSIIFFIVTLIMTIRLILFLKKTTTKKSKYDITLSKILKEYDRVIVNSKKILDIDKEKELIDVNNFSELLDVRDNLEKPILFFEVHKGQKSVFIVKETNETYRYILKAADLEKGE